MEISDGLVVTIEYSLRSAEGLLLESSEEQGPLTFKMGSERILPGLAKAMKGMRVGEQREGLIPPGELVPREFTSSRVVPLEEFPDGMSPALGDRFQAKGQDSKPVLFEVIQCDEGSVTVQLLHVYHEKELHYSIKVLAARRSNLPPPPPIDLPDMSPLLE